MPNRLNVSYTASCTKQLGTGPLSTTIYEGVFGVSHSLFGSVFLKKFREKPRRVLIKRLSSEIVSERVNWDVLRGLDHQNVARYIHVSERFSLFSSWITYIVQDYCEHTLEHFAPMLGYNRVVNMPVFKNAVKEITSGLNYLHSRSIVHRNLKPSNVLVKPPLSNPSRFILTDFWYSDCRVAPQTGFSCFLPQKPSPDDHDLLKWMAPELLADWGATSTPMMDMYSLGNILKFMISHGPLSLDNVDGILLEMLIQETISENPWRRISARDLLESHPLLLNVGSGGVAEVAYSRLNHIQDAYESILKLEEKSGCPNFRQRLESKVRCIAGEALFPWDRHFNTTIVKELNGALHSGYNSQSFIDLLKLISDFSKQAPVGIKSDVLRREIENDAVSKFFPYTIPLVYLCLSCKDATFLPSLPLLEKDDMKRREKFRRT